MKLRHFFLCFTLLALADAPLRAQADEKAPQEKPKQEEKDATADLPPPPKESGGTVKIGGKEIHYTTHTGLLPIRKEDGKVKATVFYVYYKAVEPGSKKPLWDNRTGNRPVTFCFNGGPGSSAVWLHLGGLGPKRVDTALDNRKPVAIAPVVDNPYSILDSTDLVFIDPVATGLSRAAKGEKEEQFLGVDEDIESIGEFIRLFTTTEQRWNSPKYLCGESYGVIRAAGLAEYLQDKHGLYCNGLLLVSGLLNFQTLMGAPGNDLPCILDVAAFTATAHYHKKLAGDLQGDLGKAVEAARTFAQGEFAQALFKGNSLPEEERKRIAAQLSRFTSLPEQLILDYNLRIPTDLFRRMLLKSEGKIVGGYDARIIAEDGNQTQYGPEFDPSAAFVRGAISAAINAYVRSSTGLGYQSDHPYRVMAPVPWNYKAYANRYVSMEEKLAGAMKENPALRVLVLTGRRDLVVPEETMRYSVDHLRIPQSLQKNIQFTSYESGHMMYFYEPDAVKLQKDVAGFIRQ